MPGFCGVYDYKMLPPSFNAIRGEYLSSEKQHASILFDGRIHNGSELIKELKGKGHHFKQSSPQEIILALYEDEGIAGIDKLRGPFGFALWDRRNGQFYLVRDRLGIKPPYYSMTKNSVIFSSQTKSLLFSGSLQASIDPEALKYFCFGVRQPHKTIFQDVFALPPGHYLTMNRNGYSIQEYWDVPFPEAGDAPIRSEGFYIEGLNSILSESVKLHMPSDEIPTAILLSGVLDSSVIAGIARKRRSLSTFSITSRNLWYRPYDESEFARCIAEFIGSKHTEFGYPGDYVNDYFLETLWCLECPTSHLDIQSTIPHFMAYRRMCQDGIKAVFTGSGADEILGGGLHHKLARIRTLCERYPGPSRHQDLYRNITSRSDEDHDFFQSLHVQLLWIYGHNLASQMWIKGFGYILDNLANFLSTDVVAELGEEGLKQPLALNLDRERYRRYHDFDQSLYLDVKTQLVDFVLPGEHQVSEAFGIESCLPYLDHRVVEFMATIPPKLKMRGLNEKYLLKKVAGIHFPMNIFMREKGFCAPYSRDLVGNKDSFLVNELPSNSALKEAGYFNPKFIRGLLRDFRKEENDTLRSTYRFLLERALLVQGMYYLFIKRAWSPGGAAEKGDLGGVNEEFLSACALGMKRLIVRDKQIILQGIKDEFNC